MFNELANVSINDPHPDEQASFNIIEFITPLSIFKHFMSCPPISKIQSTFGRKNFYALKCANVSTSPTSTPNSFFLRPSP